MRVLVEATCLTWIEVDLDRGAVVLLRVHAVPDNVRVKPVADVITLIPEDEVLLDDSSRATARKIATGALPDRFRMMR